MSSRARAVGAETKTTTRMTLNRHYAPAPSILGVS